MESYGLFGLGCECQDKAAQQKFEQINGLAAVSDYDQIKISGKTYTVNQILDKNLFASVDTKLYKGDFKTVVGTVKAGQPIGIVYSYLRPDQADGRSWLMFETSYLKFFFVPNEVASGTGLKDQGTLTVSEEIKQEQLEQQKESDPVGYYLKKYGLPVLLIGGGIFLAATFGKAFITGKLSQPKSSPSPALAGTKKKRRRIKR